MHYLSGLSAFFFAVSELHSIYRKTSIIMKNQKSTKNKVITLLLLVAALTITSFTGCKKDVQPDQTKPITVQVMTEGLHIENLKSFDLNQWQYNYNPNQYELTFTDSKGKETKFLKSISELSAGFQISIIPEIYQISYTSFHAPASDLSEQLDISINQSKSITTASDLTLQAVNDDFLIVLDNGSTGPTIWNSTLSKSTNMFQNPNNLTYHYAYWNKEGDVDLQYFDKEGTRQNKTITNALKGNVYHIVSSTNGNTNINITGMNYTMIGW